LPFRLVGSIEIVVTDMTPPWAKRKKLNNKKDEQDWAQRTGGVAQPSSGRLWHRKADTRNDEFLTDCKETERGSYTITVKDWRQLLAWANKERRSPMLKIKFVTDQGILELVVVPAALMET
jgi:hypothetical protein